MNFDFDDTQYALRDMARDLFAKESPPSRVRELWDGKPFDRRVWKTMADAGIVGLTVPDGFGGAGGNDIDLALVYEEAGRACLPEPLLETTGIASPVIAAFGSDAQRERWLPAIASGDAIAAVQGWTDLPATWGAEADVLVAVREDGVHVVGRDAFAATPVASLDPARPLARVDAKTGPDTKLAGAEANEQLHKHAFVGSAGLLNGVAMHLLATTVGYVKEREQFGRPVGSFQAIKHKLASMHVAIESSRPAAWYAAYSVVHGLEQGIPASIAKIAANDAEELCNTEALQCHGGIGFTWEHDLHLWLKRGMTLRGSFGTSRDLRSKLPEFHTWDELL